MCVNCSATKKKHWIFGCGTFFLLFALLIGLLWPIIATKILHMNLELREGSLNYNNWIKTPIPMYLKITMFDWTNPEAIFLPNVKPHFVEKGPYVFLERHERVNLSWNANNNTVSFYQVRVWHFVPELSNGSLSDKITNINVMASAAAYNIRNYNMFIKLIVNRLLQMKGSLVLTKTVGELLFDGYDDPILSLLKKLHLPQFKVPFSKFGWFSERNNSATYDGRFEIRTGQDDITKVGMMTQWNYSNKTKFYRDECSQVNGSSGELWPADMNPYGDITLFIPDLCHSLTLGYEQSHTRFGVTGSRWTAGSRVFDNGVAYPENACYCTGPQSSCPDLLRGVQNISDCRFGAPVFASFPHFYLADPAYVNAISGMAPERSKHVFSLALEPRTGIPLDVDARLQINILLQEIRGISIFKNVPTVMIPTFWFEQTVELDENLAREAKIALQLPTIGIYVAYGITSLGSILLIVGIVATLTRRWNSYENLDDELTS